MTVIARRASVRATQFGNKKMGHPDTPSAYRVMTIVS
jgi:hypothetical protein